MSETTKRRINGAAVRALREAVGIRQGDFAQRIGISAGSLTHVEKGNRDVSAHLLRKIADELQVPLDAVSNPSEVHAA